MNRRFRQPVTLGLSILFICTALYCYWGRLGYMHELTFLSNFSVGIFLFDTVLCRLSGRKVPQILYLDCMMLLFLVMMVCTAFTNEFKFNGMFLFLHMLNPVFMILYYFLFCDMNRVQKSSQVLSVMIVPLLYLIFAVAYGKATGDYIYFFLNIKEHGYVYCVSFVLVLSAAVVMMGCAMFYLNRIIFKNRKKYWF